MSGFIVTTPPKAGSGRNKRQLDLPFLTAYAEAMRDISDGDVVAIDQAFRSHSTAQAHATRLRLDLFAAGLIPTKTAVRARVWKQSDGSWAFGLRNRPVGSDS